MEKIEACSKIKLDLNRHTKRTIRLIHLKSVQLQQKSSPTNWNASKKLPNHKIFLGSSLINHSKAHSVNFHPQKHNQELLELN